MKHSREIKSSIKFNKMSSSTCFIPVSCVCTRVRAIKRHSMPGMAFQIQLQYWIVLTEDNDLLWSILKTSQMKKLAYFYWKIIL